MSPAYVPSALTKGEGRKRQLWERIKNLCRAESIVLVAAQVQENYESYFALEK